MKITKLEYFHQRSLEKQKTLKGNVLIFLKVSIYLLNSAIEIMNFNEMVSTLIEVLDSQAQKIEDAKLKAVGARNKIEGEEDNRRKRE